MGGAVVTEAELVAWGRAWARALRGGAVVGLSGELGAGKTTLVRAIAEGLGVREPVTSPTFALVHRYGGARGSVWHVDAYRLHPTDDVRDLGFEEMLADPTGVVLIEWPERLGVHAPPLSHRVALAYVDDRSRRRLEWT
jgi:tRNA threonylcarbamoyladenosine biosynthesis protein TsaE